MGRLGRIGPYTLMERLGRGGMGEVYLAANRRGEIVALKMLHDVVDADSEARARLEREVRALRRIESPYVARVLDADLACERPYLVMQYIEGDTLLERVRRDGPLRGAGLVTLAQGLATALSAIHAAGVVHRDLKPSNVLLGPGGEPVLIDFGIAQVLDATRLTLTGTFLGTPGYAAPELFADEPVREPVDVHAWAATVAFAATGRPTFGRGTVEAQMYAILNGQADLAGVPAALLPLVRAALHREAGKRPTAAVLATRLGRLARATAIASAGAAPAKSAGREGERSARAGERVVSGKPEARAATATAEEPPKAARAAAKTVDPPKTARAAAKTAEAARGPRPGPAPDRTVRGSRPGDDERTPVPGEPQPPRGGHPAVADGSVPARRAVRRRTAPAAEGAPVRTGPLPAGSAALLLLAVLAVPCVVATVIWPLATFAVTAVFAGLARAIWMGHWLVRRCGSAGTRGVLRAVTFPPTFAVSLVTVLAWPGLPAAGLAGFTLWAILGGELPPEWWLRPGPVAVAGVVFGVVCGWGAGREIERVSSRIPELRDLRRQGLRALTVLGGFVALCATAVRAVALAFGL
ncbi:serine/threonine-protein kinase [Streptosporangium sp. NPDC004379]|uniref:serine/threonine-protein kinase n=1 Tax=Streptosporangium sp. NPDC004379 TaxID=3366189 RepID=UPI00368A5AAD